MWWNMLDTFIASSEGKNCAIKCIKRSHRPTSDFPLCLRQTMKLLRFPQALTDRKLARALIAEFIGSGIFQLFAGALPVDTINDQPDYTDNTTAATISVANGFIYTSLGIPLRSSPRQNDDTHVLYSVSHAAYLGRSFESRRHVVHDRKWPHEYRQRHSLCLCSGTSSYRSQPRDRLYRWQVAYVGRFLVIFPCPEALTVLTRSQQIRPMICGSCSHGRSS